MVMKCITACVEHRNVLTCRFDVKRRTLYVIPARAMARALTQVQCQSTGNMSGDDDAQLGRATNVPRSGTYRGRVREGVSPSRL